MGSLVHLMQAALGTQHRHDSTDLSGVQHAPPVWLAGQPAGRQPPRPALLLQVQPLPLAGGQLCDRAVSMWLSVLALSSNGLAPCHMHNGILLLTCIVARQFLLSAF